LPHSQRAILARSPLRQWRVEDTPPARPADSWLKFLPRHFCINVEDLPANAPATGAEINLADVDALFRNRQTPVPTPAHRERGSMMRSCGWLKNVFALVRDRAINRSPEPRTIFN
jgi:hypothetical protein